MEKEHTRGSDQWVCMHSSHSSPYYFSSRGDFIQHVLDMHSKEVDAMDIESLADDCYTQLRVFEPIDCCPVCGESSISNRQTLLSHLAEHLISLSQVSLSADSIPADFCMDLTSEVEESSTSLTSSEASHDSRADAGIFAVTSDDEEQTLPLSELLSAEIVGEPPDLENTSMWADQVARAGYQARPYNRKNDEVIRSMVCISPIPTNLHKQILRVRLIVVRKEN